MKRLPRQYGGMKRGALAKYIAQLGYGSRREVIQMFARGRITRIDGRRLTPADAVDHQEILIDGEPLDPPSGCVVMLHKPTGYSCSTSDANPLVYDLLPPRFLRRSPLMAIVGRLDLDTSGLLLLTDDGDLNHRITSPRAHVPKVYDASLASDLRGDEAEIFGSGTLLLKGERSPLRPATLEVIDARHARLTIGEGRYHQVRRMFAAVGNHVEALHRSSIAGLALGDLKAGEWRLLTAEEVARLEADIAHSRATSSR